MGDVLHLTVLYLGGCTAYQRIQHEWVDERDKMLSKETYFREIQLEALIRNSTGKLGGAGYTVEIDESKCGKRKYNRGRVTEGQWVVGGICRETKEIFVSLCPDNKRDSTTLLSIIESHVDSASTVITDCWKAYEALDHENWHQIMVKRSLNFVDPQSGGRTQNIENLW